MSASTPTSGYKSTFRLLGVLLMALILSGCSSVKLAYNNLDRVAVWRTTDYVPLERDQRRWLRQEFQGFIHWHRNEQLQDWADLLRTLEKEVQAGVGTYTLLELEDRARALGDEMVLQMKPTIRELLPALNDEQVSAMQAAFAEANTELNSDYEGLSVEEQRGVWRERVRDGLRRWVGRLNAEQEDYLYAASQEIIPDNTTWVAFRERWQGEFFAAMEQRDDGDTFATKLRELLLEPEQWHPAEYQQTLATNQPVYRRFAHELLNSLDARQQRRFSNRVLGLASDLEDLAEQSRQRPESPGPAPSA